MEDLEGEAIAPRPKVRDLANKFESLSPLRRPGTANYAGKLVTDTSDDILCGRPTIQPACPISRNLPENRSRHHRATIAIDSSAAISASAIAKFQKNYSATPNTLAKEVKPAKSASVWSRRDSMVMQTKKSPKKENKQFSSSIARTPSKSANASGAARPKPSPPATMKTLSATASVPISSLTPSSAIILAQSKPQVRPKPPPKPSKLAGPSTSDKPSTKIPPATKPKPKLSNGKGSKPTENFSLSGLSCQQVKTGDEQVNKVSQTDSQADTADQMVKPAINSSTATLLINNTGIRSSKKQTRPKIKPPLPADAVGPAKPLIAAEEDVSVKEQVNIEISSDAAARLNISNEPAAQENLLTSVPNQPQEEKFSLQTSTSNSKRIVRKPSVKPPPPPTAMLASSNTLMVRNWIPSATIIDDNMDGIQLPKLPSMPPPSPPKLESTFINNSYRDDDRGEKFDDLYEEIEQAFYEEKARNSNFTTLNRLSPKHDKDQNATKSSNNTFAQQQKEEKEVKYVPKYRKKIYGRFSPPDFYRTSIFSSNKNRHYDTLYVSGQENSQQQSSSSSYKHTCMNISCSNDSGEGFARNGSQRRSSADYYKDSADYLSDEEDPEDAYAVNNSYPFSSSLNRAENGVSSTATFSALPLRWRHCGRYDTWSSTTNPDTATMIRSVVENGNSNDSVDSRSHSLHKNSEVTTTGRTKSSQQHKRKSLSELWRFKSELQLNLSKKMDQIRLKVNGSNTSGFSSARAARHPNTTSPSSMFYVSTDVCSHGTEDSNYLDYWQEDPCIGNEAQPATLKNNEECIYGDDWSSSSDEEQDHDDMLPKTSAGAGCAVLEPAVDPSSHNHQPTIQSSLLAEIEIAYQELALKRHQRLRQSDQTEMTSEEFLAQPCSTDDSAALPCSSMDTKAAEQQAAKLAPEQQYDEQRLSQPQIPSSSSILQRHSTIESSRDDQNESNQLSDSTTTRNSSQETSLYFPDHDCKAHLNSTTQADEEDGDSAESSSIESRSLYTSRLPEPQPLYQIYMQQEQEKLLLEAAPVVQGKILATTATPKNENASQIPLASVPEIIGNDKLPTILRHTTVVPPPAIGHHEEHEADSVCGSCSNETDDIDPSVCIRRQSSSASTDSGRGADAVSHIASSNTSMRRERLTAGSMCGSQRSLWCELAEVKSAGLLQTLDEHSKKLQEAFFEVITSEASYLRSINILITSFMAAPELMGSKSVASVITNAEKKQLFSNIQAIRDASERLLCDLESRLKECLVLSDVCDILCEHFEKYFDSYVKYCSNQVYQDRTLKRLKAVNSQFVSCVQKIESDRQCQGLDMRSFLMLPMQRITRYPLLVYAILDRVDPTAHQHTLAARALILANQVVRNCNEGARRMERTEQLLEIERRMVYKSPDLKRIPLVSSGRYVIKSGTITQLLERRSKAKLNMLQSKQQARNIYLFLFSDLLVIAKKKTNGTFVCKDYAQRRFIVIEPVEPHSHKVPAGAVSALTGKPHLFFCILMQNARGKQVEFLLNAESESDRERWLSAMRPPSCANPDEKIYAEWDCPQAIAVHNYEAAQEDELDLENGDLINILRKMPDGWFYGENMKNSKGGWFPSSYVQQVLNDHVRANNYRQRLKVIQAAADYRLQHHHPSNQPHGQRTMSSMGEKRASSFASTSSASALSNGCTPPCNLSLSVSSSSFNNGSGQQIINRLRRLSNPKAFFSTSNAPSPTPTSSLSHQLNGEFKAE